MTKKQDIKHPADVELFVRTFYEKALEDQEIGFIFKDIAQIDLEEHLPKLFQFWEHMLLGGNGYKTNLLKVHLDLNEKSPLLPKHFERWLYLFNSTIDQLFEGIKAQQAKNKALSIATVMQIKLDRPNTSLM